MSAEGIWKYHNRVVRYVKSQIEFCQELAAGEVEDKLLWQLKYAGCPDFDEPEVLVPLGKVASRSGNPARCKHAQAVKAAHQFLQEIQDGDTMDGQRIARIAEKFLRELSNIAIGELETEASAACSMLEAML